jgi:hypothetical protein
MKTPLAGICGKNLMDRLRDFIAPVFCTPLAKLAMTRGPLLFILVFDYRDGHNLCISKRDEPPMKKIPLFILTLALACAALVAQQGTTPAAPKQILFDFRVERPNSSARIPAATQRLVLSKLFRRYLTDESKCNPNFNAIGDDPLKAARNAGQITPSIIDMATGSFTAAGQAQTAYVISVSECNASHADNFGTKRVAIFSGQQMVADVDADFRSDILRKTDLNGDGMDELLMASGYMGQGILTESAALVEFLNGRLRVIEDFGTVTEDSCASEMAGSSSKASVLSVLNGVPGRMPRMRIDNYSASCRTAKRWRFVSTGKMQ